MRNCCRCKCRSKAKLNKLPRNFVEKIGNFLFFIQIFHCTFQYNSNWAIKSDKAQENRSKIREKKTNEFDPEFWNFFLFEKISISNFFLLQICTLLFTLDQEIFTYQENSLRPTNLHLPYTKKRLAPVVQSRDIRIRMVAPPAPIDFPVF